MNKLNLTNKTSIAIIIALTLFSTNIYAQIINPNGIGLPACTSCSGTTVSSTKVASTLGIGNEASDTAAFASGYYSEATGHTSTALGYYSIASGDYATAIGNYAEATYNNSFAFGKYVKTSAINTFAFGFGEASQSLNNNVSNSIMFGVGSSTPALTIRRYTGAGRVGIGTTNPQADLDVNGTIKTTGFTFEDGNEGSGKVLSSNASGDASWADPKTLGIWSLNDDNAWFSTGNVGIGTSTPSEKLDVVGNIGMTGNILGRENGATGDLSIYANTSTSNGAGIKLYGNSNTSTPGQIKIIAGGVDGDIEFSTNGSQRMKILDNGNVGIGTASPGSALEINGTTKTTNFTMSDGADNGHLLQSDGDGVASWVDPTTLDLCEWSKSGDILYVDGSTYDQVGLFNSTPVADFQIGPDWTFTDFGEATNKIIGSNYKNDGGAKRIGLGYASSIKFDTIGSLVFNTAGYGSQNTPITWNSMAFTYQGNLGVGTTNPTSKLHLNGSSDIDAHMHTSGPNSSLYWVSNQYRSYGFGVDASGNGRIYHDKNQEEAIMTFFENDKVLIGDYNACLGNHKLYVNGSIITTEVKIAVVGSWADYVFQPDYKLPSLTEVETFINENGHLPGVPSQEEVKENGIKLAETDATLLKKIEELTLYILQQEKKINQLEERFEMMEEK